MKYSEMAFSFKHCILLSAALLLFAFNSVAGAASHPSSGCETKPLPDDYSTDNYGYGAEYNTGSLTFTQEYPDPATLTHAERYIIAGTVTGPKHPWWHEVFMLVMAYYSQYGEIPTQITPEVIAAVSANEVASEDRLAVYRSPITGEYPVLNSASFDPGQVYCRLLTEDEMRHIASVDGSRHALWYESKWINPKTREVELATAATPPLYIRFYGYNGVIYESILEILVNN